jgi:hypothetical protein
MKIFNKLLILLSILTLNNINASTYSCLEDQYNLNQCKFDIPKIENGETKVVKTTSGLFEGRLVASCKDGKRVIISESCDFAFGEEDACKGIAPNTWTGQENATCNHKYQAVAVNNGETYKVYSTKGNGYIEYRCNEEELSIKSMDCKPPQYSEIVRSQSIGSTCTQLSYLAETVFDYAEDKYIPVPPNDTFCINEGYDKMDTFSLETTESTIQSTGKATYNVSCCRTQELGALSAEVTVNKIDGNCASVSGVLGGDYNDLTGRNTTQPSGEKVLNNFCKPNSYNELSTFTVTEITSGKYTYDDEFQVNAMCCGLVNASENNQDCKGQFISSGSSAEVEAQSYGIPYLCDSSSGIMECYQNTCTEFVAEAELCDECEADETYSFTYNNNTCSISVDTIYSGHETVVSVAADKDYTGYAVISCMNGADLVEDSRCFKKCKNERLTWTSPNGGVCYYDLTGEPFNHYFTPTDNDLTNPYLSQGYKTEGLISEDNTGIAYFHCDNGNWVENSEHISEPVCFASCEEKTVYWGADTESKDGRNKLNACQSPISEARHYQQPVNILAKDPMANVNEDAATDLTTTTNSGTASFVCNDGSWELASADTCNLDCLEQTVQWEVGGVKASATVAGSKHGTIIENVMATGTNYGQSNLDRKLTSLANFKCDDGKYILFDENPTVYEQCNAGSVDQNSQNYTNACEYSWDTIQHGTTVEVTAGGDGTGTATLTCNNGNIEVTNLDCNKHCDATTVSWIRTSGAGSTCPSGFTLNDGVCEKTNSVDPECVTNGYTFNSATGVCEKTITAESSNDADIVCQGDYDGYSVTGTWNCYKKYIEIPVCPSGYTFNGAECEANTTQSVSSNWECPTSLDPETPEGATAEDWVYHSSYNAINILDEEPNCASGYSFDSSTGKCKTTSTIEGTWSSTGIGSFGIRGNTCDTTSIEYKYMSNRRTTEYSGTCSNINETKGYNLCSIDCEPARCTQGQDCPTYACEYVTQTCEATQAIYVEPTCSTGYILQSSGYCRKEVEKTNACVRDINVTPTCPSGYTWNGSQCQGTSLSNPQLSCSAPNSGLLKDDVIVDCGGNKINEQCCVTNITCLVQFGMTACGSTITKPDMNCTEGTLSGEKCQTTNYKAGTCPSGYAISGGNCKKIEVIDANETCPDGSTAPCTVTPVSAATCSKITLPNGTKVTPTLSGNFCVYEHTANGVAEATCPSGQTVLGDQCINTSYTVESEFAVCSNNGIISDGKCVKTESFEAPSNEPVKCSVSTLAGNHKAERSLLDNTTNGATGSATITCKDGNWLVSNASCYKDCSSTIQASSISTGTTSWDLEDSVSAGHDAYGLQCTHNDITKTSYGHEAKEENVETINSEKLLGEIDYTCNDGWWVSSNSSCTRISCADSNESWTAQSTCTVSTPSNMKWGDETTIDQPSGFSGEESAQFKCLDDGKFYLQNTPDCNADCNTNSESKGLTFGNCYTSMSDYMTHDTSDTYYDLSGGHQGETVVSCNNGVLSNTTDTLCNPYVAAGTTFKWNSNEYGEIDSTGKCEGTLSEALMRDGGDSPYFANQDCETVENTASGYTGSISLCATSTGAGYTSTGSSCNANCSAGTVSWSSNNCSVTMTEKTHGFSGTQNFSGTDYTGSATVGCNNGTWTTTSTSCTANCDTNTYTPNCPSGYSYVAANDRCEKTLSSLAWNYDTSAASPRCVPSNSISTINLQGIECDLEGDSTSDFKSAGGCNYASGCSIGNSCGIELKYICEASTTTETATASCDTGYVLDGDVCVAECNYTPPPPPPPIVCTSPDGNEGDTYVVIEDNACRVDRWTEGRRYDTVTYECQSGVWESIDVQRGTCTEL